MGGDQGVTVVVPAALYALRQNPELNLILVGDQSILQNCLKRYKEKESERLRIQHASEIVAMDDLPSLALRNKKDSSMRVALNLVKANQAQACVSAGNTGALMATARFVLKTLPGIDRPAIVTILPTIKRDANVRVLDLGANVDCSSEHLFQFAVMGSVLASAVSNIERPTIGLLNIGEEEIKGNEQVKDAARLLVEHPELNYIGYIEGDAIYKGVADVIVCDGFVGNVMLKTSEGLARMIAQYIKEAFHHNWFSRISGLAVRHVLRKVGQRIDPARYNGASLVGLRGTVIKSHGSANKLAYANAIQEAFLEVKRRVPFRIGEEVSRLLTQR